MPCRKLYRPPKKSETPAGTDLGLRRPHASASRSEEATESASLSASPCRFRDSALPASQTDLPSRKFPSTLATVAAWVQYHHQQDRPYPTSFQGLPRSLQETSQTPRTLSQWTAPPIRLQVTTTAWRCVDRPVLRYFTIDGTCFAQKTRIPTIWELRREWITIPPSRPSRPGGDPSEREPRSQGLVRPHGEPHRARSSAPTASLRLSTMAAWYPSTVSWVSVPSSSRKRSESVTLFWPAAIPLPL